MKLGLAAAAVLLLLALWARGEWYRGQAIAGQLRADSLEAVADTTRRFHNGELADAERRAIQATRKADALDKALHRATVALAHARVVVKPLDTTSMAPVTLADTATRVVVYRVDRPPYHLAAIDSVPPPPDSGRLALAIRLDPAVIQVRAQCGQAVRGVKPASILFQTPDWLTATIDTAQLTPLACNEGLVKMTTHGRGYYVLRGTVLVTTLLALNKLLSGWF